jgi:hypothetical protein
VKGGVEIEQEVGFGKHRTIILERAGHIPKTPTEKSAILKTTVDLLNWIHSCDRTSGLHSLP